MGNKIGTLNEIPYISKDLWRDIFEYLDGEDILKCSLVCKHFYELNRNNELWFRKIFQKKLYLTQKVSRNHPMICYYSKLNYKQYYLSLFHHSYQFGLFAPYTNLKLDYEKYVTSNKNKFLFFGVYVPVQILFFPVYCFFEAFEFIKCKRREKKYCNCKECYRRQYLTLMKIR